MAVLPDDIITRKQMTVEEYLAFERASETKHEYMKLRSRMTSVIRSSIRRSLSKFCHLRPRSMIGVKNFSTTARWSRCKSIC